MLKCPQIDKFTLNSLYTKQKLSTYKIANRYLCHPAQIRTLLKQNGITIRSKQQAMFIDRGINITKSELYKLYIKNDLTAKQIGQICNCYESTICDYLNRYQIPIKPPKKKYITSKDELMRLYLNNKISIRNIAHKFKVSEKTVTERFKDFGITPRKLKNVYIDGKTLLNLYEKGYSLKRIGEMYNVTASTVLKKTRSNNIPLRSTWEASTGVKKPFNGTLEEKAYMIGFRIGDLGVRQSSPKTNRVLVGSNTTKDEQVLLMSNLFKNYSNVWVSKPNKIGVMSFSTMLHPTFSFLLPKNDNIESWIKINKKLMTSFVAGYIDAEGSFGVYNNRSKFRIGSYDKNILKQIDQWLSKLKIKSILKLERIKKLGQNNDFWRITVNEAASLNRLHILVYDKLRHKKRKSDFDKVKKNIFLRSKNGTIQL